MKKYFIRFNSVFVKGSIIIGILISIFILGVYLLENSKSQLDYLEKKDIVGNMELIFFGLGEADSTLIRYKDQVLLIDTGEIEQSDYIIDNLRNLEIDMIDYLILTHPDKDHIGSAAELIKNFDVGMIIQSSFQKSTKLQEKLNAEIKRKGIKNTVPEKEYEFNMGEVKVKVSGPEEDEYKKSNNYSLVTSLTHGKLNYFFAGDAEKKRLEEILKYDLPEMALYKVPHHGRNNKKSSEIIEKLSPEIAIITSSEADKKVLAALLIMNTKVYYTADKTIRFISDGIDLREH